MADDPKFTKVGVHRGDDRIPRDHHGRYLLPEPGSDGSSARAWTRVTTIAGELKDRYGLEKWDQRNIVFGIGQRQSLFAQAAASKLTDVKTLDKVAKQAMDAADSSAGADMGSALHTMAERMDRGEEFNPPDLFADDLAAYHKAMEIAGIDTCVGWIERVVVIPEIGACGTLDRLSNAMEWTLPRIGDLKTAGLKEDRQTGKERDPIASFGLQDIPLQLAMYAHGTHWYDLDAEQWVEMPKVDQKRAMVYHVPAGSGECRVWEIDIEAGWQAVKYAMWERDWRRRKDLGEIVLMVNINGEISRAQSEGADDGKASNGERVPARETSDPAESKRQDHTDGEGDDSSPEDPPAHSSSPSDVTDEPSIEEMAGVATADEVARCVELYGDAGMPEYLTGMEHVDDPLAPADTVRWAWARQRVNDMKSNRDAARRLAQLWSVFDAVPLFPNDKNPDRSGPRTWAELSKVIGMLDLVEMEFQIPFPEANDPNPDVEIPSPSERRQQREQKYQNDQTARHKANQARKRKSK